MQIRLLPVLGIGKPVGKIRRIHLNGRSRMEVSSFFILSSPEFSQKLLSSFRMYGKWLSYNVLWDER